MSRLFGTDGVRGVANRELTCELAMDIGRAAATVLRAGRSRANGRADAGDRPVQVLIGKDTRVSCDMLEAALVAGLCSIGADVQLLGVIPTPAVAYLVKAYGADAGIVISASHNSFEHNGIKIFNRDGYKLSDELEDEIERVIRDKAYPAPPTGGDMGRVATAEGAAGDYVAHLLKSVPADLSDFKLLIDCANGAASATAPMVFPALGAQCTFVHHLPDGLNINAGCGSTHIENLAEQMKTGKYDAALAFDGDADRLLMLDAHGNLVDGDQILIALGTYLKKKNELPGDTVVVTVMSNLGFFHACERQGLRVAKTKVGDRYVLEHMMENSFVLGGEQSGHIIALRHATTGDGELTALLLLAACKEQGITVAKAAGLMERYPQVLIGVKATPDQKHRFETDPAIAAAIRDAEARLGDAGRVLVRPSGTEPLIRVMAEGREQGAIQAVVDELAAFIQKALAL
ncbi:MAG: phosphoglucosamine mutase [Oscillospiraceae bacterium]|nr:phosphoglucosamine mutase [Oscillospiraceae bacterium]